MSAFPQPGYYPQPGYPAPALVPQQTTLTPEGQAIAAQVAQGQFPFKNRWEVVGQVFSTNPQDPGFRWMNATQPQGEGHLEITLKLRRAWGGQRPGVSQSKIKVIAYGALGQAIMQQIRTGVIIRAVGEGKVSNFQKKRGPQAGQWTTSVQVQLRQTQGGEVPFEVLGILPLVDEAPQHNGYGGGYGQPGYGAPAPQPSYAAPAPGGYAPAPGYAAPAPAPTYAAPAPVQPVYAAPAPAPAAPVYAAPVYAAPAPAAPAPTYAAPAQPVYAAPAYAVPAPAYAQPGQPGAPIAGVIPGTPPAQVNVPGCPQGTFMPPPPGAPVGAPAPFPQPPR